MLLGGRLGHQQEDEQADGLFIRCVETDGSGQLEHGGHRRLQTLDAPMRNGDTVAQPRGAQAFAGEQAVRHQGAAEAV